MPKFYEVTAMTDNVNDDRTLLLCVMRFFCAKFAQICQIWSLSLILAYKYDIIFGVFNAYEFGHSQGAFTVVARTHITEVLTQKRAQKHTQK